MRFVNVAPTGSVARAVWRANAPRAQATNAPATIRFPGFVGPALLATGPSVLHLNMASLLWSALGWKGIVPGAQTERRGDAGPMRVLPGGGPHRPLFVFTRKAPRLDRHDQSRP